jgi:ATP-binding cassette subfamily F protein 3
MGALSEEELGEALSRVLLVEDEGVVEGLDSDLVSYLAGMLSEGFSTEQLASGDDTQEAIHPFLESAGCDESLVQQACEAVHELAQQRYDSQRQASHGTQGNPSNSMAVVVGESQNLDEEGGARKLRQGVVSMASDLTAHNEAEADATRYMWGQDNKVSAMTNAKKDAYTDLHSSKDRRKQKQELGKTRKEYEVKVRALEEEDEQEGAAAVSAMVLPDYRSGRNEKDIQVRNVMLSLDNGRAIMDSGEIRFAYRRRYGLVGPSK